MDIFGPPATRLSAKTAVAEMAPCAIYKGSGFGEETGVGMHLEHIINFLSISPALATGGQPSEQELGELAQCGFRVVINLGLLDPRYCLPNEDETVTGLGMRYHHLPVDFEAPKRDDLRDFFELMAACHSEKVFVHCAANKRVSVFVALYGEARLGWSPAEGRALIARVWNPTPVWARFIESTRTASWD